MKQRSGRARRWLALLMASALVLGPIQPALGAATPATPESTMAAKAAAVHERMDKRVTQEEREAAAAQLAELMEKAADGKVSPSAAAPPPGPGGVPDYFSMTPNWANSPELRKFVDGLPGVGPENANNLGQYLSVAHPDTITYPGSDYYEIELRQYTEQLHSDMPGTLLRGYVQVNKGTDSNGKNTVVPDPIHYLGPTILATKDRPVRIKFTNKLPTGEGGDLFIPVDKTYMGAGYGPEGMMEGDPMYTENRAVIHLHGGKTVWISDGTPHQWITPAGENTPYPKGVSVQNVPDMPDPGDGSVTLFYSNQQSARMLWYHDHAYGITRLNVLAGMAAGYFIADDTEKELIADGLIPEDQIPLIIQDKTFVDAETIETTDPTWNWGATPGTPHTGDLWFPHVYMPAQNPALVDGVNPMGRWHYGPWFWPPTQVAKGPVANPYYDPEGSTPWENPTMPGTPDDSSGMEAFMDTPLVNGTAYPTMNVDPKSYRMRILNAASDRFWNLQMYVADPGTISCDGRRNTEVKMVPASATEGWPADWPTDGREGGVPDPKTAGPDWIQIGTEGGFLPQVAVRPQQPITWVTDVTLFNAGNVDKGSLLLAPAERADVVVDFSKYAGKTLIMYNDAPAAFPAGDPRYDYYTGAPDMTDTGGTAGTRVGFGPNTRTIMQIKVAAKTAAPAFDLTSLEAAFVSTGSQQGVFEKSQNKIIVPNERYNTTYDAAFPRDAYVRIFETSFTFKNLDGVQTTFPLEPKAIQDEQGETFDEFGRMSGKLGLERPTNVPGAPNFNLYGYQDPPTEVETAVAPEMVALTPIMGDGTQIWKITHNGVDTHPMHFHLYDVQLINRVGWDGFLRYPEDNELGWKDTVRVSPLEDTIVALRPVAPTAPFNVPDSIRPLDPTMPLGHSMGFSPVDPATGQPYAVPIVNEVRNFSWEYVWHCHILSHEEMDMMRPVTVEVASSMPATPVLDPAALVPPGATELKWVDGTPVELPATWGDPANEIGFRIERAPIVASVVGEYSQIGTALANQVSFVDDSIVLGEEYSYRVIAYNQEGNTTSTPVAIGPVVDDTSPVTTSNIDGSWHQEPFSVSLDAVDTLSGVASTSYVLDSGSTQSYSAPFDVTGEGTHTVEFWSEDTLGAIETHNNATVKIDNTAPVTSDNHMGSYTGSATIALSAADPLSGVAKTYYKLDGGATVAGSSVMTSVQGAHSLQYWSEDNAGNLEVAKTVGFAVLPSNATYVPLEGTNRIRTALEVSRQTFPMNSVDTVVIAGSDAWPDALVGASLAGAYQSPILLTSPSALSSGLSAEIARIGASKAVILGSTASVGSAVENSLKTLLGTGNVKRIGGVDRYDTARLVAAETVAFFGCNYDGTAFVTTGLNFPDALAAGPLAASKGWPIYLVRPSGLGSQNAAAMLSAGVTKALVLGSTSAAPASIPGDITGMVGATVTRLEGSNRYATAVKIAEYGVANAGLKWDGLAVATGENFPDGLSAGAAQGYSGSVLLLTPTNWLANATKDALLAHKNDIAKVKFIGSDAAISPAVRTAVAAQLN